MLLICTIFFKTIPAYLRSSTVTVLSFLYEVIPTNRGCYYVLLFRNIEETGWHLAQNILLVLLQAARTEFPGNFVAVEMNQHVSIIAKSIAVKSTAIWNLNEMKALTQLLTYRILFTNSVSKISKFLKYFGREKFKKVTILEVMNTLQKSSPFPGALQNGSRVTLRSSAFPYYCPMAARLISYFSNSALNSLSSYYY